MSNFKIFDGIFKTYEEANHFASGNIFDDEKYLNKTLSELKKSKKSSIDLIKFTQRYRGFGNFLCSAYNFKKKINILDFGGGMGNGYLHLKKTIPNKNLKKIKYSVIDGSKVILKSKKYNKEVFFYETFPKIKVDVFISSSSIQYLDNLNKFINTICKFKSKYIILLDVFAGDIPSYFSLQKYYNIKTPHAFLNEKFFLKNLQNRGYDLILSDISNVERAGLNTQLNMSNFPKKYRLQYSKNYIFKIQK